MAQQIGTSAEGLLELARNLNVSVQAISRRLIQRFNLRIVVASWECRSDGILYESNWLASSFSTHHANIKRLTIGKNDPAFKFFHEHDSYRVQVWTSLGGPMDAYFVDSVPWSYRSI